MWSTALGSVVAAVVVSTGWLLLPPDLAPAPHAAGASAAACSGSSGVTTVVDFNQLGGGVTAGCASAGGGKTASAAFRAAGYTLQAHPRMPDFICKVQGRPTDGQCAETDAFWSLWWSDGSSGKWVWANRGAGGLTVPDGGYVAFAWHQGGGDASPPDVKPTPRGGSDDTAGDGGNGNNGGDGGNDNNDGDDNGSNDGQGEGRDDDGGRDDAASPGPTTTAPTASSTPTTRPSERVKRKRARQGETRPTATFRGSDLPEADEITEGPPPDASDADDDDGGSVVTWVAIGLAVLVLGAAGAVPILRRRGR